MCSRKSNALLQFYVLTLFIGFLCNFFATILPFWFAKYPEEFISPLDQQRVYTGCFYIFDKKISPLWPLVFAAWFHAAQALQILSMILYSALLSGGLAMLLNACDRLKPRTVLVSIGLLVLCCWVLVTQLGVVGVNVDLEKKQTIVRGEDTWLSDTRQSTLSWSYGLAAFSLLFVLIALNILVWCVYPRKERGGRLLKQAWKWPSTDDLPCCQSHQSTYQRVAMKGTLRSQGQTLPTEIELEEHPHHHDDRDVSSQDVVSYDPRSTDESEVISSGGVRAISNMMNYDEGSTSPQGHDPRTAVDWNFSRVSSRMSSVRSSSGRSSGFSRALNQTYIVKKGPNPTAQGTIIPKPMIQSKMV